MYPDLKIHTEIIMTGAFIETVLNKTFDLRSFEKEWDTTVDFIQPSAGYNNGSKKDLLKYMDDFFPKREKPKPVSEPSLEGFDERGIEPWSLT